MARGERGWGWRVYGKGVKASVYRCTGVLESCCAACKPIPAAPLPSSQPTPTPPTLPPPPRPIPLHTYTHIHTRTSATIHIHLHSHVSPAEPLPSRCLTSYMSDRPPGDVVMVMVEHTGSVMCEGEGVHQGCWSSPLAGKQLAAAGGL